MTKLHPRARPLAEWERDYIIENYGKISLSEISRQLGVSHHYVRDKVIEMNIHTPKRKNIIEKTLKLKNVDKKLNFEKGQVYTIKENSNYRIKEDLFAEFTRINGKRKFEGKLIDITKDLLIFDNGRYIECVRKVDFITGDYEVIK